jgi:pimeloyl-ACP methyl ester carboxylesterase
MSLPRVAFSKRAIGCIASSGRKVDALILFSHATGLCKELWNPVIDELSLLLHDAGMSCQAVTFDFTGHGDSWKPGRDAPKSLWVDFCPRNVQEVLKFTREGIEHAPVVGVGHSMGAAGLAMAEMNYPGTFNQMILHEPILFPPMGEKDRNREGVNMMVAAARKRRSRWESFDGARNALAGRGMFKTFDERAFDMYIQHALRPTEGGVELKCSPHFEADMYDQPPRGSDWANLKNVDSACSISVGEWSRHMSGFENFPTTIDLYKGMNQCLKHGTFRIFPDAGHFAPQEKCKDFAKHVFEQLTTAFFHREGKTARL